MNNLIFYEYTYRLIPLRDTIQQLLYDDGPLQDCDLFVRHFTVEEIE